MDEEDPFFYGPMGMGGLNGIPTRPPKEDLFRRRDLGLGTIVAVASTEPFYGRSREWHWLFQELRPDRWMWYRRHGLSRQRTNPDFWK